MVALGRSSTGTPLALGARDRVVGTADLGTGGAPEHAEAHARAPVLPPKARTADPPRAAAPDPVASSPESFSPDRAGGPVAAQR
ncbi:hypothetical protein J7S33_31225, partial [Saccharothrix algeriensis]